MPSVEITPGLPPCGLSFLRDCGDAGVFRVVPMQVSLPATYFVLEYQPFDSTAKASLKGIKQRLRPFPVRNPLLHWSQHQLPGSPRRPATDPLERALSAAPARWSLVQEQTRPLSTGLKGRR